MYIQPFFHPRLPPLQDLLSQPLGHRLQIPAKSAKGLDIDATLQTLSGRADAGTRVAARLRPTLLWIRYLGAAAPVEAS